MNANLTLLRQISVLSILFGIITGFITLIPFINTLSFMFLILCIAPLVICLLLKYNCISLASIKESIVIGAIAGFVGYIAFSIIYIPISVILLKFFNYALNYGIAVMLNNAGFFILTIVSVFLGVLSATTNAFTGFLTFYIIELINSISKK